MNKNLAEFYGIMLGDGCLSYVHARKKSGPKYLIFIAGNSETDPDFFNFIASLIYKLCGRNVKIRKRSDCNGIEIKFSSKHLFFLLHDLGFPIGKKCHITIPRLFLKNKLWIHITRGIFDTDGCVVFSKQHKKLHYYPRIEITSSSKELIYQIRSLLPHVGLASSYRRSSTNAWRLEVAGAYNFEKWMEIIGSNNPKHLQRYLIWKQLGYYPLVAGVAQ